MSQNNNENQNNKQNDSAFLNLTLNQSNQIQQMDNFTIQEKENWFEQKLNQQVKNDIHLNFFIDDPKLLKIVVPIISQNDKQTKIKAFRNFKCRKPECVYAYQDLLEQFRRSQFDQKNNFICRSCNKNLNLMGFYHDLSLQQIIEEVWQIYNRQNKVPCEKVIIYRDGNWEPQISKYMQEIDEKLRDMLKIQKDRSKLKGARNMQKYQNLSDRLNQKKILLFEDFNQIEYDDLMREFQNKVVKTENLYDNFVEILDVQLNYSQITNFVKEIGFAQDLIILYLKYLSLVLQWEHQITMDFYILKYKEFNYYNKTLGYQTLYEQIQSENRFQRQFQIIFLNCEERWIVGILEKKVLQCQIVDFLDGDLTQIKEEDLYYYFISMYKQELGVQLQNHNFEFQKQCQKIGEYQDLGIYQCAYLQSFFNNISQKRISQINLNYLQIQSFKKCYLWLIFIMPYQQDKNNKYYKLYDQSDVIKAKEENKLLAKKYWTFEDDNENDQNYGNFNNQLYKNDQSNFLMKRSKQNQNASFQNSFLSIHTYQTRIEQDESQIAKNLVKFQDINQSKDKKINDSLGISRQMEQSKPFLVEQNTNIDTNNLNKNVNDSNIEYRKLLEDLESKSAGSQQKIKLSILQNSGASSLKSQSFLDKSFYSQQSQKLNEFSILKDKSQSQIVEVSQTHLNSYLEQMRKNYKKKNDSQFDLNPETLKILTDSQRSFQNEENKNSSTFEQYNQQPKQVDPVYYMQQEQMLKDLIKKEIEKNFQPYGNLYQGQQLQNNNEFQSRNFQNQNQFNNNNYYYNNNMSQTRSSQLESISSLNSLAQRDWKME